MHAVAPAADGCPRVRIGVERHHFQSARLEGGAVLAPPVVPKRVIGRPVSVDLVPVHPAPVHLERAIGDRVGDLGVPTHDPNPPTIRKGDKQVAM